MITIDHRRMNTPTTPPKNKKSVNNISKSLKIMCTLTTAALLLTACDSPAGGTTSNNDTGNKDQPKPKFAVTYAGEIDWRIAGLGSFRPIGVSSESSNGSTLAKAYTITVGPRVGTGNSRFLSFRPTFKPTEAKDGATFAIQAIDPTTGADLAGSANEFDTKFAPANLVFQAADASAGRPRRGNIHSHPTASTNRLPDDPPYAAIPPSGHLAYKITITPKANSAYDGPKVEVFVKIAVRTRP